MNHLPTYIKENGIRPFASGGKEDTLFHCPDCNGIVSFSDGLRNQCLGCERIVAQIEEQINL